MNGRTFILIGCFAIPVLIRNTLFLLCITTLFSSRIDDPTLHTVQLFNMRLFNLFVPFAAFGITAVAALVKGTLLNVTSELTKRDDFFVRIRILRDMLSAVLTFLGLWLRERRLDGSLRAVPRLPR